MREGLRFVITRRFTKYCDRMAQICGTCTVQCTTKCFVIQQNLAFVKGGFGNDKYVDDEIVKGGFVKR